MFLRLLILVVALGGTCNAVAQGSGGSSPPYTADGHIAIRSISPPTSVQLKPGTIVRITVEFSYSHAVSEARADLVIQEPAPSYGPIQRTSVKLSQPMGMARLSAEFVVPKTRTITVFLPLYTDLRQGTSTVDSRVYEVEAE